MNPIYLDYAATTPVDDAVAEKMQGYLTQSGVFGNPASPHQFGFAAKDAVKEAAEAVARLIHAHADEIIWTSGATESNNLAIKGVAQLYAHRGKHIITLSTEHKSVLDVCAYLAKQGYAISVLSPDLNGLLDLKQFEHALRPDTILVSIMHVNNETGVIQDIAKIAAITAERGVILHVDAAQSAGKIPIDLQKVPVDLLSLCAHKLYGPKGIGALYVRKKPRVRLAPQMHGGEHQQSMRAGTLPTHQIVGMGEACRIALHRLFEDYEKIQQHRRFFLSALQNFCRVKSNSPDAYTIPHILNLCFIDQIADTMLTALPGLAFSTSAACQGLSTDGSYVLRALGLNTEALKSAIRFSFGRYTTEAEIRTTLAVLKTYFHQE